MDIGRLRAGECYALVEVLEGIPTKQWRRLEPTDYGGFLRLETTARLRDLIAPGRDLLLEQILIGGNGQLMGPVPMPALMNTGLPEMATIDACSVLEVHYHDR